MDQVSIAKRVVLTMGLVLGVVALNAEIEVGAAPRCAADVCTPEENWTSAVEDIAARDGITVEQASVNLANLLTVVTAAPAAAQTATVPVIGSYVHPVGAVERWHAVALQVGWPESDWRKLSCIINRESRGNPSAHNGKDSGHGSFGLTQLNMTGNSIRWFRNRGAFWSTSELYNGEVNLHAALIMRNELGWGPWKSRRKPC